MSRLCAGCHRTLGPSSTNGPLCRYCAMAARTRAIERRILETLELHGSRSRPVPLRQLEQLVPTPRLSSRLYALQQASLVGSTLVAGERSYFARRL